MLETPLMILFACDRVLLLCFREKNGSGLSKAVFLLSWSVAHANCASSFSSRNC